AEDEGDPDAAQVEQRLAQHAPRGQPLGRSRPAAQGADTRHGAQRAAPLVVEQPAQHDQQDDEAGGEVARARLAVHGHSLYRVRGNAIASRMCAMPQIHATVRSTPSPKPAWTKVPYLRRSRYQL